MGPLFVLTYIESFAYSGIYMLQNRGARRSSSIPVSSFYLGRQRHAQTGCTVKVPCLPLKMSGESLLLGFFVVVILVVVGFSFSFVLFFKTGSHAVQVGLELSILLPPFQVLGLQGCTTTPGFMSL